MDSARHGFRLGHDERSVVAQQGGRAMRRVVDHLSVSELERRFVGCADPVEARHVQVIWLLAQGHTVGATSRVTAFGTR